MVRFRRHPEPATGCGADRVLPARPGDDRGCRRRCRHDPRHDAGAGGGGRTDHPSRSEPAAVPLPSDPPRLPNPGPRRGGAARNFRSCLPLARRRRSLGGSGQRRRARLPPRRSQPPRGRRRNAPGPRHLCDAQRAVLCPRPGRRLGDRQPVAGRGRPRDGADRCGTCVAGAGRRRRASRRRAACRRILGQPGDPPLAGLRCGRRGCRGRGRDRRRGPCPAVRSRARACHPLHRSPLRCLGRGRDLDKRAQPKGVAHSRRGTVVDDDVGGGASGARHVGREHGGRGRSGRLGPCTARDTLLPGAGRTGCAGSPGGGVRAAAHRKRRGRHRRQHDPGLALRRGGDGHGGLHDGRGHLDGLDGFGGTETGKFRLCAGGALGLRPGPVRAGARRPRTCGAPRPGKPFQVVASLSTAAARSARNLVVSGPGNRSNPWKTPS